MDLGRNEPCYCGSGKKYKKCCLPKDEKSRHENEAELTKTAEEPQPAIAPKTRKRAPDPRVEACEARFREFQAAEYEDRFALFVRTLDDLDLMDAEMAFEMLNEIFCASAGRGDRDRFDALVENLREHRHDVYVKQVPFFLKWRITNALVAARPKDVSILTLQLAPLASKDIDLFNRVESRVAYHGHLTTLVEAMRLAWPGVKSSSDIVPWGIDEFCTRAITYEVLNYADSISEPAASDPSLAERIEFFSHIQDS